MSENGKGRQRAGMKGKPTHTTFAKMAINKKFDKEYKKRERTNLSLDETTGKWFFDIQIGGKRYKRVIGEKRREAEEALAAFKAEKMREKYLGIKPEKEAISFADFSKKYLEHPSTKEKLSFTRDKQMIDLHLAPFFGDFLFSEINSDHIGRYTRRRGGEKTWRDTITTGATINREVALFKAMVNRAIEWGDLESSPVNWKRIKPLYEEPRDRVLTQEQALKLIDVADKDKSLIRPFLLVALNTGLRKSEILGLTWDRIDFQRHELIVKRRKKRAGKDPYTRIPINQDAIDAIKDLPRISNYIFCHRDTGERVGSIYRAFQTACKRAGIEDIRIHDLRHTFASTLNAAGVDLVSIRDLLGHSSTKMTEAYIKPFSTNMRRATDSLAGLYVTPRREETPGEATDKAADEAAEKTRKEDVSVETPGPQTDYIQ